MKYLNLAMMNFGAQQVCVCVCACVSSRRVRVSSRCVCVCGRARCGAAAAPVRQGPRERAVWVPFPRRPAKPRAFARTSLLQRWCRFQGCGSIVSLHYILWSQLST